MNRRIGMKKFFLVGLFLLLLPIMRIKAFYCRYSDISYLKKVASNINTSYDYVETTEGVTFSITLTNLNSELYLVDSLNKRYDYKDNELTISGYHPGQTIQFKVYTTRQFCEKELLSTIRLTLPSYNPYYKDKVCSGLEDYNLCNRWSSHGLSYTDFVKRVNQYKQSLIKEQPIEPEPVTQDNSIIQFIARLLVDYYYIILGIVIIGCSVGIYVMNKKNNTYY